MQDSVSTPAGLGTGAVVTFESEGRGSGIGLSALTLRVEVPNVDQATFARLADEAQRSWPVFKSSQRGDAPDTKFI